MKNVVALVVSAMLCAACGSGAVGSAASPAATSTTSAWERAARLHVDTSVVVRIDDLASSGDCRALQDQFDIAESNRRNRYRPDLMEYIDSAMKSAGCY